MTNKEALDIVTDWFHSYKDDKGQVIHEKHITEKYKEAKEQLEKLVSIADSETRPIFIINSKNAQEFKNEKADEETIREVSKRAQEFKSNNLAPVSKEETIKEIANCITHTNSAIELANCLFEAGYRNIKKYIDFVSNSDRVVEYNSVDAIKIGDLKSLAEEF